MDWTAAIEKNREALKRVLALLVAMAEMGFKVPGGRGQFTFFLPKDAAAQNSAQAEKLSPAPTSIFTLPRHLYRAMLRQLRPAESAVRRLIIVAAHGLVVALPARPREPEPKPPTWHKASRAGWPMPPQVRVRRVPSLSLLDPLPPWRVRAWSMPSGGVPRISVPGFSEPFGIVVSRPDDPIDATRIALRLERLASALDDLPGQARRFARWRAWRDAAMAQIRSRNAEGTQDGLARGAIRFSRLLPLKPGHPPGWRRRPAYEVDEVLNVVHGLAVRALQPADTS